MGITTETLALLVMMAATLEAGDRMNSANLVMEPEYYVERARKLYDATVEANVKRWKPA